MLQKDQAMDALLHHDLQSSGGRFLKKQIEPVTMNHHETPLMQEMANMHMDFVEEGYWKRCAARKLSIACKEFLFKNP